MAYTMTPRRFAHINVKNASVALKNHETFLSSYDCLKETLSSELSETAKFQACQVKLIEFDLTAKLEEAKLSLTSPHKKEKKAGKKKGRKPAGRYEIKIKGKNDEVLTLTQVIFDDKANKSTVEKPMEYAAKDYASAERLSHRKLAYREDAAYAEITNLDGKGIMTRVERREAIARIFAKPKGAVMRGGKKSADLHWKPKSHATRQITSWNIMR